MSASRQQTAFVVPASASSWQRWVLYSSVARVAIFVALFVPGVIAMTHIARAVGWVHTAPPLQYGLGQFFGRVVPALVAYLLLTRFVERRRPVELLSRRTWLQALTGVGTGTLLFSSIVGVLWLLGSYHVVGFNPHANWVTALLMAGLGAGIGEEIMFRGVLFRVVEEGAGSWVALAVSALFFGAVHLGNPNATLWSSLAIAIEAGLLFGVIFMVTRSLPICMGLHAAWNFCQGTVYGIPVSGLKADGWLVSTRSGPNWLTGGDFGAEASVIALLLCSALTLALLSMALKRNYVVSPAWTRRARSTDVATQASAGA
jgi:membrane protease YdiL (CAAX protease family)